MLALVGCTTPPPVVTTYTFYNELDPSWTDPCEVIKPPIKQDYLEANHSQRAMMMGLVYIDQVESVAKCNVRIKEIRTFNDKAILHNQKELKRMQRE